MVIILYTSQFVLQYVISIVKLAKDLVTQTHTRASEEEEERVDPPHPNRKIAFSEELLRGRPAV